MAFHVKIKDVKTSVETGQYGEYSVTAVTYEFKGAEKRFLAYPSTLKKYPNLKSELSNLKTGMTVGFQTTKTDKGSEISQILFDEPNRQSSDAAASSATHTFSKSSFNDNALGMQVGNALTNAVSTLGVGASLEDIENRVWDLIQIGERTKRRLENKEHQKSETASNNEQMNSFKADLELPF